jgi:hypothetical protein
MLRHRVPAEGVGERARETIGVERVSRAVTPSLITAV